MDSARSARQQLDKIEHDFDCEIREVLRRYMGARGKLTSVLSILPQLPVQDRADLGSRLNDFKARTEVVRDALRPNGEPIDASVVIEAQALGVERR